MLVLSSKFPIKEFLENLNQNSLPAIVRHLLLNCRCKTTNGRLKVQQIDSIKLLN